MNGLTGGNRDPWQAGALAVAATVAVLAAACDVAYVHFGSFGHHGTGKLEAGS